jgi:hypothetical protein
MVLESYEDKEIYEGKEQMRYPLPWLNQAACLFGLLPVEKKISKSFPVAEAFLWGKCRARLGFKYSASLQLWKMSAKTEKSVKGITVYVLRDELERLRFLWLVRAHSKHGNRGFRRVGRATLLPRGCLPAFEGILAWHPGALPTLPSIPVS